MNTLSLRFKIKTASLLCAGCAALCGCAGYATDPQAFYYPTSSPSPYYQVQPWGYAAPLPYYGQGYPFYPPSYGTFFPGPGIGYYNHNRGYANPRASAPYGYYHGHPRPGTQPVAPAPARAPSVFSRIPRK